MKTTIAFLGAASISGLLLTHAAASSTSGTTTKVTAESISPALAAKLAAAEAQPTIEPGTLPYNGRGMTYYSAQYPSWPAVPENTYNLPLWKLGTDQYLIDDLAINYAASNSAATTSLSAMALMTRPMAGGGFLADYSTLDGVPYLTIAPTGTNQFLVTVFNSDNSIPYYLEMTPVLGNTNFPWVIIANGAAGQTNFTVANGTYANEYFQVLMTTNYPGQGIAVFIDSPASGATVQ